MDDLFTTLPELVDMAAKKDYYNTYLYLNSSEFCRQHNNRYS